MCLAKCVFLYFCLKVISAQEFPISLDYYDDGLRSECRLQNCTKECRPWPATCERGFCECFPLLARVRPSQLAKQKLLNSNLGHRKSDLIPNNPAFPQNPSVPPQNPEPEDLAKPLDGQLQKPALRHHIAHFCINIPAAEACIRTCMKVGKPAFCGKDHVCYCGHTYNSHDKNEEIDIEEVHNQYRDLYQKYFGPEFK